MRFSVLTRYLTALVVALTMLDSTYAHSDQEKDEWNTKEAARFIKRADGIERGDDVDAQGRKRTVFTPQVLQAANCSAGRHWELISGIAGCVCDGDSTHTRVGNNEPDACLVPISQACSGTELVQTLRNGSTVVVEYNSASCVAPKTVVSQTCSGSNLMNNYSDGSTDVAQTNSSRCAPVPPTLVGQTCNGYSLMNVYDSGDTTVAETNSATCGWKQLVGQSCSGLNLMNNYSDGTSSVAETNSATCDAHEIACWCDRTSSGRYYCWHYYSNPIYDHTTLSPGGRGQPSGCTM